MANKERIHENASVVEVLKNISYSSLSGEARKVMTDLIQNAAYLGKTKVQEKDVYYIVKNSVEISTALVNHNLEISRMNAQGKLLHSKSSIEKYKRISTAVAVAFSKLIAEGVPMNKITQYKPQQMMTEEQREAHQTLMDSGAGLQALIDQLVAMKKTK